MVAVTGLMRKDSLFTLSFFEFSFGAVFWAARTSLLLKENHYSIGTFKEKSFVGNYVSNSLHLTLAMIVDSKGIQKYAV